MMKLLKLVAIALIMVSCQSKEKETTKIDYPEKTSFSNQSPDLKASMAEGKLVYNDLCITCHMANGKGVTKVFPPLAQSDYLKNNQEKSIIGIKKGMKGEMLVNGVTYNSVMTAFGLSNKEVADVMNYINHSWGNNFGKIITTEDVTNIIKN